MKVSLHELTAIGDLTLTWNSVEEHLQWLIWTMASWTEPVGSVVTADLGNVARVQLALNLAHLHLDEHLTSEVQVVMAFLDVCRARRNDIIHGLPIVEPSEPRVLRKFSAKTGKGKLRASDTPLDTVHLQTLIQDMLQLMLALTYLQMVVKEYFSHRKLSSDQLILTGPEGENDLASECIGPIRRRLNDLRLQHQNEGSNQPPPQSSEA